MGKYSHKDSTQLIDAIAISLHRISNEYAEANRLKRLEMELTHTWSVNAKKLLEDQA